ncbi:MAG: RNA methyltransferase [Bacteroidota bacterium]|nr:RNA methyltransferase [Bacteroidota bacterium]
MEEQLIEYFSQFLTPERVTRMLQVLDNRTKYLTVVLEDVFQPQNASAVLRTCECFGIQDIHIIEDRNDFIVDPNIAMGASKWLSMHHYNSPQATTREALLGLKENGYRIVATTPHEGDTTLEEFDLEKGKTALIFGTELTGISDQACELADEFLKIPMHGFTESFNISNSVAIILHHLSYRLSVSKINYRLTQKERQAILLEWLRGSIKSSDLLEKNFFNKLNHRIS